MLLLSNDPVSHREIAETFAPVSASVDVAAGHEEALGLTRRYEHDLVVLDETPAPTRLGRLRAAGLKTPLIWLCGAAGSEARAAALNLGADDCIGPGMERGEVLARALAVVRRAAGQARAVIDIDGLSIDIAARTVAFDDRPLCITGKEFGILEVLALRRGRVVSRGTLMDHLYGGPDEPVAKILDIHVCRIRRKLAQVIPGQSRLRTIWGRGFLLGVPGRAA